MPPQSSFGVAFRDQVALERVLGTVAKRPRRAKQLTLKGTARQTRQCMPCGRLLPRGKTDCPDCGAFLCRGCDELTSGNGGSQGFCLECLVCGREADPRAEAAE